MPEKPINPHVQRCLRIRYTMQKLGLPDIPYSFNPATNEVMPLIPLILYGNNEFFPNPRELTIRTQPKKNPTHACEAWRQLTQAATSLINPQTPFQEHDPWVKFIAKKLVIAGVRLVYDLPEAIIVLPTSLAVSPENTKTVTFGGSFRGNCWIPPLKENFESLASFVVSLLAPGPEGKWHPIKISISVDNL